MHILYHCAQWHFPPPSFVRDPDTVSFLIVSLLVTIEMKRQRVGMMACDKCRLAQSQSALAPVYPTN
jgi:hypothetical protein